MESAVPGLQIPSTEQQPPHIPQSPEQLHSVSDPLQMSSPHSGIEITHCLFWQILPLLVQFVQAAPFFPHEVSVVPELHAEPLQQPQHIPQSPEQLHSVSDPLQMSSPHSGDGIRHAPSWHFLPAPQSVPFGKMACVHWVPEHESLVHGLLSLQLSTRLPFTSHESYLYNFPPEQPLWSLGLHQQPPSWHSLPLLVQFVQAAPFFPHAVSVAPELHMEPLQQPEQVPQSPEQLHVFSPEPHCPSPHTTLH